MIKAQAFREESRQTQPCREDYVFDEKPKGNFAPLAFLAVLTGFAVYLKSFFSAAHEAPPPKEHNRAHAPESDGAATQPAQPEEARAMEASPEEAADSNASGSSKDPAQAKPKQTASREWPDEFVGGSAQARTNSQAYGGPDARPGANSAANDNNAPVKPLAYESADTIRTGVGGGGGGDGDGDGGAMPDARVRAAKELDARPDMVIQPPRDDGAPQNRNRLPRTNGPIVLPDLIGCHAYFIPVLALLAGASDPDGDSLKVLALTSTSGKLTPVDGGWMFTLHGGGLRDVAFKYAISDGIGYVEQVAQLRIVDATPIVGTDGDDNLLGTACSDVIDAKAGDDNIDARDGNDVITAGEGDDHIVAGAGHDIVFAGGGADIVLAGAGNDIVYGGAGSDRLFGEAGDDTLLGEHGDDLLVGGDGNDILVAGDGNDTVQGDAGNDTLDGGAGNDKLDGGDGADRILAGDGNDDVSAGDGEDVVLAGAGADTISADAGNDIVEGGEGNDILQGGAGNDVVSADAGDDALRGNEGDDTLSDGHGSDTVDGGGGDDYVTAAADTTTDSYDGGAGEDTLDYSSAILDIFIDIGEGTANGVDIGRDLIANFERIIGGQGDDHFVSEAGPISMTGGDGDDTFEFRRFADDHQPDLVRKITDFAYGDRIIAARYEIYYRTEEAAPAQLSDLFDDIYLSENNDRRPIRFRFEKSDDLTVVDIQDGEDPEDYYSIQLPGHHNLEFTVVVS
jgi:Ca2+-binding RTX toxin-like protein